MGKGQIEKAYYWSRREQIALSTALFSSNSNKLHASANLAPLFVPTDNTRIALAAQEIPGNDGMKFEQSIVIAGSPEDLFRLTQDYNRRLEWDPFLKSARLVGDARSVGVGVRAYCVARSGLGMETEYVSFNPPRVTAVKMTRSPWLIASFAGSWRFEEVGPGQTRVQFCYQLQGRPKFLSWLVTPLLAGVFGRDTRKRLLALKAAVEERGLLVARPDHGDSETAPDHDHPAP